jgi:hypothetical protein
VNATLAVGTGILDPAPYVAAVLGDTP